MSYRRAPVLASQSATAGTSRDSESGWYEYLRHCRAEHLAGKPVPSWLRRWREEERREREDAKRQGPLPL